ncbi:MAG: hypothetical protein DCE87_02605 [Betaproteobacteria bacterium]|nr:MAG: hypothetical protein DCE87_02605 [Betaproteobacteria bacterium]PZO25341.1 MAG: hypothetical protein DCE89_03610 [Betaproteobacteria bacterium]
MNLDRVDLRQACFEVARSIRWRQNPVDEVLAKASVDLYFKEALNHEDFLVGQGRDPNIIVRAVRYIAHKHAIPPMEGDIDAFSVALEVLIELICPNTCVKADQETFFRDIEEGIQEARGDYA